MTRSWATSPVCCRCLFTTIDFPSGDQAGARYRNVRFCIKLATRRAVPSGVKSARKTPDPSRFGSNSPSAHISVSLPSRGYSTVYAICFPSGLTDWMECSCVAVPTASGSPPSARTHHKRRYSAGPVSTKTFSPSEDHWRILCVSRGVLSAVAAPPFAGITLMVPFAKKARCCPPGETARSAP